MKYLVLLILLLTAGVAQAQQNRGPENSQKVRQAKIAYITGQVNLTPEQAQRFWPLYDQYDACLLYTSPSPRD